MFRLNENFGRHSRIRYFFLQSTAGSSLEFSMAGEVVGAAYCLGMYTVQLGHPSAKTQGTI